MCFKKLLCAFRILIQIYIKTFQSVFPWKSLASSVSVSIYLTFCYIHFFFAREAMRTQVEFSTFLNSSKIAVSTV